MSLYLWIRNLKYYTQTYIQYSFHCQHKVLHTNDYSCTDYLACGLSICHFKSVHNPVEHLLICSVLSCVCLYAWNSRIAGWIFVKSDTGKFYKELFNHFNFHFDLKCNSLNIYWSEKCIRQQMQRKMIHTSYVHHTFSKTYGFQENWRNWELCIYTELNIAVVPARSFLEMRKQSAAWQHLAYTAITAHMAMPRICRRIVMDSHLSPLTARL
jgi:hypothetical protein